MSFNNNSSTDLSRFSIGEIVDLSGVPNFYNAGSSKYLRSATATASSNLSATAKTNLSNAGTDTAQTVLVQSSLSSSYNGFGLYATYPIARISASNISVVPSAFNQTTDVGVGVITSAGMQVIPTGQTSLKANSSTSGANGFIASNDTKIFSYSFPSAAVLSVKSTTNGTTWTTETVTGLPTFAYSAGTCAHASQSIGGNANVVAGMTGWKRNSSLGSEFAVFFCGARFLLIAPGTGTTNYVVSLSSNGFTFGGDNTTAVLGSNTIIVAAKMQFYRNGNNCFLNVGTFYRFSTDGGITWAASTFAASPSPSVYFLQYNTTDPAKLIIMGGASSDLAYYTANSGATWSANRALPNTASEGGLWYKGSTVVFGTGGGQGINKVSTDDGVTYTNISFPIGTLGNNMYFAADANRFYAGPQGIPQILTSSNGVDWTLITLTQNFALTSYTTNVGYGIITYAGDSNTVVFMGKATTNNQCLFSLNGGVTWTGSQYTVPNIQGIWNVGYAFSTPDGGGVAFAWGSENVYSATNTNVLKADITAGGAFYRTGVTAITPIRANALSYVRVE